MSISRRLGKQYNNPTQKKQEKNYRKKILDACISRYGAAGTSSWLIVRTKCWRKRQVCFRKHGSLLRGWALSHGLHCSAAVQKAAWLVWLAGLQASPLSTGWS